MKEFLTFFILSLFVVISPGVDTALITKRTLSYGRRDGYKMAFGITSGSIIHTFATAFGLSAILLKSAIAFEVVKYFGTVYLMYLGASSFFSKKRKENQSNVDPKNKYKSKSAYKQGLQFECTKP